MIYLTLLNEYDPWPGATTFRTFQLPELIADTLTAGRVGNAGGHPAWQAYQLLEGEPSKDCPKLADRPVLFNFFLFGC